MTQQDKTAFGRITIHVQSTVEEGYLISLQVRKIWTQDSPLTVGAPSPHWSFPVSYPREKAAQIETIRARHLDPFPCIHARYIRQSRVILATRTDRGAA